MLIYNDKLCQFILKTVLRNSFRCFEDHSNETIESKCNSIRIENYESSVVLIKRNIEINVMLIVIKNVRPIIIESYRRFAQQQKQCETKHAFFTRSAMITVWSAKLKPVFIRIFPTPIHVVHPIQNGKVAVSDYVSPRAYTVLRQTQIKKHIRILFF